MAQETANPPDATDQPLLQRDGTSQAARAQPALDPGYVSVDERSPADLLAFARAYARELNFFDVVDQQLQVDGDWSGFIGPDLDLDEAVAFMREPHRFSTEQAQPYARPHFALFLTFLRLLRYAQDQLNTLTRRHLDFYYQQVLRIARRPGIPDQVSVLIDLAPTTEQLLLPAGTLLRAGADSRGQDLFYSTDRDLIASHAQISQLSSVYAEKRLIDIHSARVEYPGPRPEAFLNMLRIALGDPLPGDALPAYPTNVPITYNILLALHSLVEFTRTGLFLEFPDLHTLMQLKHQRDGSDAEWQEINQILEQIGRKRTGNANFKLQPTNPRDFDANLKTALGGAPNFDELTEVEDIYDLYDQRIRASVQQFIHERLYFDDLDDFYRMMQIKVRIDNEWGEINRILEAAGQRKGKLNPSAEPPYTFPVQPPYAANAFAANLEAAVGPLKYPSPVSGAAIADIDSYYKQVQAVEAFFFMPLQEFAYLMAVAEKPDASPQEWDKAEAILAGAHRAKVYAERRDLLRQTREEQGFDAMIAVALGEQSSSTALDQLEQYIRDEGDVLFLRDVRARASSGSAITAEEWDRTYRVVELAQRSRLGEPVAQKEEWLNLYPAADATAVKVKQEGTVETDPPRWKTFGQGQPVVSQDDPVPPSTLGWAISSPLLALSEGQRTITLTLGFAADQFRTEAIRALFPALSSAAKPGDEPFQIEISTEKGWIKPDTIKVTIGDYSSLSGIAVPAPKPQALQFVLTFAENIAALAPPPTEQTQFVASWPVLRLMLRQIWQPAPAEPETGRYISHYQPFRDLVLLRVHLRAAVAGLTPQQAQNDEAVLDAGKPFEPFGSSPSAGARLYLGHPELVYKKLDSLRFNIEWMRPPDDLKTYYKNYPDLTIKSNQSFTARISLIDQRIELPLLPEAPLFASPKASALYSIDIPDLPAAVATGRPGYVYARAGELVTDDDLLDWNRYVQWELNALDFQHEAYPAAVARRSLELSVALSKTGTTVNAADYQINPPYTPKLKRLSLDYSASLEILMASYQPGAQADRIFHIHPFGYSEAQPDPNSARYLFLPQYGYEGELYLGIAAAQPPQDLTLLFQLAEGSADPDQERAPVQWSYLSGDRWVSLGEGGVLLDTTRDLINSGIVALALPPAQPSTLLPPGLYWLRAAIAQNSAGVCDTIAIHTQAVTATFADRDNAPDHLDRPLPAGSIAELVEPLPEVAGIRQPYTSYGGKMAEQDQSFYTRTSERLRHKHRALTIWDYERMILERFPQVYKAKCLPAAPDAPGRVEIIVIPNIRNKLPFDPFAPKAPADQIANIKSYLAENSPAFAMVRVKNAHYVRVKVRFAVRFRPGNNEGFYKQRLNEDLNRFLSPWAYEEGAEIVIGGRMYANVIINFIEERPYVDYVAKIKLFSSEDGRTFRLIVPSANEGYWVEAERPDSVLVAARQHEIDMIPATGFEEQSFTGINYMKIELDFIVG